MNEWGFAAEVSKWWENEFRRHPEWRLSACRVEETVPGSRDRSDLLALGNGPVICGELRLPDHPLADPWHPDNLLDAINKATIRGCQWAFTSDCRTFLLIDTRLTGPPLTRIVQEVDLLPFSDRRELDSATFLVRVQESWLDVLREVAPTLAGLRTPAGMAPDTLFINALRALLSAPVAAIRDELNRRRLSDPSFEQRLVEWMVDEQGWAHAPEKWEAEVLRAAQLTAYVFATRLVFYEALRRSQPALPALGLPDGATARIAQAVFREYFAQARDLSGDYDTLFDWDTVAEFALIADVSVPAWQRVIAHIGMFNVSDISYDILGRLFERLIDPFERYRWGQHYTSPDVVDLMLSVAIPDGRGAILDPAAGGGTFLVRAYARKRVLQPDLSHQQILAELYGLDTSGFAATLATVNLAVRSLQFADNYPRVATRSFFQVDPGESFMSIPTRISLGRREATPVAMAPVKAVVSNPPYIRLHELGPERLREAERVLGRLAGRVPTPTRLPGLSNYHIYFWLHGAQFLEPGGRLVLLTAGEWMDSDYGAALQLWLLNNFCIELCIESMAEPWFSEARVGTVVTVAKLNPDEQARESSKVRFVQLRKKLRELYGPAVSEEEHLRRVDALRDRLLTLPGSVGESDEFDWTTISQRDLRLAGSVT